MLVVSHIIRYMMTFWINLTITCNTIDLNLLYFKNLNLKINKLNSKLHTNVQVLFLKTKPLFGLVKNQTLLDLDKS